MFKKKKSNEHDKIEKNLILWMFSKVANIRNKQKHNRKNNGIANPPSSGLWKKENMKKLQITIKNLKGETEKKLEIHRTSERQTYYIEN